MAVSSITKLAPDYQRATEHLLHQLNTHQMASFKTMSPQVHREGAFSLFPGIIPARVIPSEPTWRWVKSKSKKEIAIHDMKIHITKLIPRTRNYQREVLDQSPNHTLWMYYIYQNEEKQTALWCEKGTTPELDVNDFVFLAPFMSPEHVMEIWGDRGLL